MRESLSELIREMYGRITDRKTSYENGKEIRGWIEKLKNLRDSDYADRLESLEKRMDAVEMQRCGLRGEEQVLESLEQFIQEWRGD